MFHASRARAVSTDRGALSEQINLLRSSTISHRTYVLRVAEQQQIAPSEQNTPVQLGLDRCANCTCANLLAWSKPNSRANRTCSEALIKSVLIVLCNFLNVFVIFFLWHFRRIKYSRFINFLVSNLR